MDVQNSQIVALLIFFSVFMGILFYVFASRKRGARLETYRYTPFLDEDEADRRVRAAETSQLKGEK
jgi:cbb3-type cytochrome oxidase subunit 3